MDECKKHINAELELLRNAKEKAEEVMTHCSYACKSNVSAISQALEQKEGVFVHALPVHIVNDNLCFILAELNALRAKKKASNLGHLEVW